MVAFLHIIVVFTIIISETLQFFITPAGALAFAKIQQQKAKAVSNALHLKNKATIATIQARKHSKHRQSPRLGKSKVRRRSTENEDWFQNGEVENILGEPMPNDLGLSAAYNLDNHLQQYNLSPDVQNEGSMQSLDLQFDPYVNQKPLFQHEGNHMHSDEDIVNLQSRLNQDEQAQEVLENLWNSVPFSNAASDQNDFLRQTQGESLDEHEALLLNKNEKSSDPHSTSLIHSHTFSHQHIHTPVSNTPTSSENSIIFPVPVNNPPSNYESHTSQHSTMNTFILDPRIIPNNIPIIPPGNRPPTVNVNLNVNQHNFSNKDQSGSINDLHSISNKNIQNGQNSPNQHNNLFNTNIPLHKTETYSSQISHQSALNSFSQQNHDTPKPVDTPIQTNSNKSQPRRNNIPESANIEDTLELKEQSTRLQDNVIPRYNADIKFLIPIDHEVTFYERQFNENSRPEVKSAAPHLHHSHDHFHQSTFTHGHQTVLPNSFAQSQVQVVQPVNVNVIQNQQSVISNNPHPNPPGFSAFGGPQHSGYINQHNSGFINHHNDGSINQHNTGYDPHSSGVFNPHNSGYLHTNNMQTSQIYGHGNAVAQGQSFTQASSQQNSFIHGNGNSVVQHQILGARAPFYRESDVEDVNGRLKGEMVTSYLPADIISEDDDNVGIHTNDDMEKQIPVVQDAKFQRASKIEENDKNWPPKLGQDLVELSRNQASNNENLTESTYNLQSIIDIPSTFHSDRNWRSFYRKKRTSGDSVDNIINASDALVNKENFQEEIEHFLNQNMSDKKQHTANQLDETIKIQRLILESLVKDADLLLKDSIGQSVLHEIELRTNSNSSHNRIKRTFGTRLPLTRLVSDPHTRLDVSKTLDNFGTVARNTFEDSRAPLYHVRNLLGNAKNTVMASLKVPPSNILIPTKYDIKNIHKEEKHPFERVGAINTKLVSRNQIPNTIGEENLEPTKKLPDNDAFGVMKTFHDIGHIIRASVDSGKSTLQHASDTVHDAKNIVNSARYAVPRLIIPASNIPVVQRTPKKAMLIAPRIMDVAEDTVGSPREAQPNFVSMGNVLDAVGVSDPSEKGVELQKIIIEPRNALSDVDIKSLKKPEKLRAFSPIKEWVQENKKIPTKKKVSTGIKAIVGQTLDSLQSAKESVGARNLKEFLTKMKNDVNTVLRSDRPDKSSGRTKINKLKSNIPKKAEKITLGKNRILPSICNRFASDNDNANEQNNEKEEEVGLSSRSADKTDRMDPSSNDQMPEICRRFVSETREDNIQKPIIETRNGAVNEEKYDRVGQSSPGGFTNGYMNQAPNIAHNNEYSRPVSSRFDLPVGAENTEFKPTRNTELPSSSLSADSKVEKAISDPFFNFEKDRLASFYNPQIPAIGNRFNHEAEDQGILENIHDKPHQKEKQNVVEINSPSETMPSRTHEPSNKAQGINFQTQDVNHYNPIVSQANIEQQPSANSDSATLLPTDAKIEQTTPEKITDFDRNKLGSSNSDEIPAMCSRYFNFLKGKCSPLQNGGESDHLIQPPTQTLTKPEIQESTKQQIADSHRSLIPEDVKQPTSFGEDQLGDSNQIPTIGSRYIGEPDDKFVSETYAPKEQIAQQRVKVENENSHPLQNVGFSNRLTPRDHESPKNFKEDRLGSSYVSQIPLISNRDINKPQEFNPIIASDQVRQNLPSELMQASTNLPSNKPLLTMEQRKFEPIDRLGSPYTSPIPEISSQHIGEPKEEFNSIETRDNLVPSIPVGQHLPSEIIQPRLSQPSNAPVNQGFGSTYHDQTPTISNRYINAPKEEFIPIKNSDEPAPNVPVGQHLPSEVMQPTVNQASHRPVIHVDQSKFQPNSATVIENRHSEPLKPLGNTDNSQMPAISNRYNGESNEEFYPKEISNNLASNNPVGQHLPSDELRPSVNEPSNRPLNNMRQSTIQPNTATKLENKNRQPLKSGGFFSSLLPKNIKKPIDRLGSSNNPHIPAMCSRYLNDLKPESNPKFSSATHDQVGDHLPSNLVDELENINNQPLRSRGLFDSLIPKNSKQPINRLGSSYDQIPAMCSRYLDEPKEKFNQILANGPNYSITQLPSALTQPSVTQPSNAPLNTMDQNKFQQDPAVDLENRNSQPKDTNQPIDRLDSPYNHQIPEMHSRYISEPKEDPTSEPNDQVGQHLPVELMEPNINQALNKAPMYEYNDQNKPQPGTLHVQDNQPSKNTDNLSSSILNNAKDTTSFAKNRCAGDSDDQIPAICSRYINQPNPETAGQNRGPNDQLGLQLPSELMQNANQNEASNFRNGRLSSPDIRQMPELSSRNTFPSEERSNQKVLPEETRYQQHPPSLASAKDRINNYLNRNVHQPNPESKQPKLRLFSNLVPKKAKLIKSQEYPSRNAKKDKLGSSIHRIPTLHSRLASKHKERTNPKGLANPSNRFIPAICSRFATNEAENGKPTLESRSLFDGLSDKNSKPALAASPTFAEPQVKKSAQDQMPAICSRFAAEMEEERNRNTNTKIPEEVGLHAPQELLESSKQSSKTQIDKYLKENANQPDLGQVLGAINPVMFERYFNESLCHRSNALENYCKTRFKKDTLNNINTSGGYDDNIQSKTISTQKEEDVGSIMKFQDPHLTPFMGAVSQEDVDLFLNQYNAPDLYSEVPTADWDNIAATYPIEEPVYDQNY